MICERRRENMSQKIRLRVAEAKPRDEGQREARINHTTADALRVKSGDVIAIQGKHLTFARVWHTYLEDQTRPIIRLGRFTCKNAGVSPGDFVTVAKADVKPATYVAVAPIDLRLSVDQAFRNFLKRELLERPLVVGNQVDVNILQSAVPFIVKSTTPKGVVQVTPSTRLRIHSTPDRSHYHT
jgi:transitional endoplasmic reticulum ATPase